MEGRASSQSVQQGNEDKWKGALKAKQFSRIVRIMEGRASSQTVQQDSEDKWKGALPATPITPSSLTFIIHLSIFDLLSVSLLNYLGILNLHIAPLRYIETAAQL